MSYLDLTTYKSYNFVAPRNPNDPDITLVPFPVASVKTLDPAAPVAAIDGNPTVLDTGGLTADATLTPEVSPAVQPGSLVIVRNGSAFVATLGGVDCAAGTVTTLLYDGNGYIELGSTTI